MIHRYTKYENGQPGGIKCSLSAPLQLVDRSAHVFFEKRVVRMGVLTHRSIYQKHKRGTRKGTTNKLHNLFHSRRWIDQHMHTLLEASRACVVLNPSVYRYQTRTQDTRHGGGSPVFFWDPFLLGELRTPHYPGSKKLILSQIGNAFVMYKVMA